ncbi:MAG: hypothetical protein NVSMB46_04770 [Candidatus Saccharimonadales bacterium]
MAQEIQQNNDDYVVYHPGAIQDAEEAHEMALSSKPLREQAQVEQENLRLEQQGTEYDRAQGEVPSYAGQERIQDRIRNLGQRADKVEQITSILNHSDDASKDLGAEKSGKKSVWDRLRLK